MLSTVILLGMSGCRGIQDLFLFSACGSAVVCVCPQGKGIHLLHKSCRGYLELLFPAAARGWVSAACPGLWLSAVPWMHSQLLPAQPARACNLIPELSSVSITWVQGFGNVGLLSWVVCVGGSWLVLSFFLCYPEHLWKCQGALRQEASPVCKYYCFIFVGCVPSLHFILT